LAPCVCARASGQAAKDETRRGHPPTEGTLRPTADRLYPSRRRSSASMDVGGRIRGTMIKQTDRNQGSSARRADGREGEGGGQHKVSLTASSSERAHQTTMSPRPTDLVDDDGFTKVVSTIKYKTPPVPTKPKKHRKGRGRPVVPEQSDDADSLRSQAVRATIDGRRSSLVQGAWGEAWIGTYSAHASGPGSWSSRTTP
jgi:hypothetical protein